MCAAIALLLIAVSPSVIVLGLALVVGDWPMRSVNQRATH